MPRTARTRSCMPPMLSAEPRYSQPAAPTGPLRLQVSANSVLDDYVR